MADKKPLKIDTGQLQQFSSTDTVPSANLNLTGAYPVTYTSGTGVISFNEGFPIATARGEIYSS